jgi:hypothetical protein
MSSSKDALSVNEELALGRFVAGALDVRSSVPKRRQAAVKGLSEAIDATIRVGADLGWCVPESLKNRLESAQSENRRRLRRSTTA